MSYMRGTFSLLSPAALLQALCQEQRSAFVAARHGQATAAIWIAEGLIVGARCEDLDGPEAVYRLAGWGEGQFLVTQARDDAPATMAATCEELLLEAARRRDEAWPTA
ncbi:MAG: DUF4388 domain-containing protein [Chloroflexales bacterium]|nr:DUF4388 domain-containing protein [Chloroflexales bacterium]